MNNKKVLENKKMNKKQKRFNKEEFEKLKDELEKKYKEGKIKSAFFKKVAKIMFDKKEEEK